VSQFHLGPRRQLQLPQQRQLARIGLLHLHDLQVLQLLPRAVELQRQHSEVVGMPPRM
jgi:hypothetical protein